MLDFKMDVEAVVVWDRWHMSLPFNELGSAS